MVRRFRLVVLGNGSAAFAAATRANDTGVSTAMVSHGEIGGTCVNVGCVPSKNLLEMGNAYKRAKSSGFDSIKTGEASFDFRSGMEEKRRIIEELRESNYRNVISRMPNVTLTNGKGRFIGRNVIDVNGEAIEGEKILIAVGSSPYIPQLKGVDEAGVLTSEDMLSLDSLPESLIVVGGRVLGLEFAQMFSRFGSQVTLLQRSERVLPGHEREISEELTKNLRQEGISIFTNVGVEEIHEENGGKVVKCRVAGNPRAFTADHVLMATGRRPNVEGLGLDLAGVETRGGFIKTDESLRTTNPAVYAAGDCASEVMLETLAARMGYVAVRNAFEGAHLSVNVREFPSAVFTDPQVATVGYTEDEYMATAGACACRTIGMDRIPKARILKDTRGIIKMVVDPKTLKIMGVHIVAPTAADMIHEATLAVKLGLTIDDIISTPHVFPTATEAIKAVAHAFRRDVSSMSCCIE